MAFLDWLLAAPIWVKACLSSLWWLALYLLVRLGIWALTGGSFWRFDAFGALFLAWVSYLAGWRHRGDV